MPLRLLCLALLMLVLGESLRSAEPSARLSPKSFLGSLPDSGDIVVPLPTPEAYEGKADPKTEDSRTGRKLSNLSKQQRMEVDLLVIEMVASMRVTGEILNNPPPDLLGSGAKEPWMVARGDVVKSYYSLGYFAGCKIARIVDTPLEECLADALKRLPSLKKFVDGPPLVQPKPDLEFDFFSADIKQMRAKVLEKYDGELTTRAKEAIRVETCKIVQLASIAMLQDMERTIRTSKYLDRAREESEDQK